MDHFLREKTMNSLYAMNNPYGIDQTNRNYSSNRQQLSDNDLQSHHRLDYYQQDSSFHPNQFYPDNSNQFYRYDNGSSR